MREKHIILIKKPLVSLLIMASLFFMSCSGNKVKDDKVFLSENGIALTAKAVHVYQDLNNALKNQQYDTEMIRILNDPAPSEYLTRLDGSELLIAEGSFNKQTAFSQLRKAYASYNLFLDRNFDYGSSDLKNSLATACAALDSFQVSDFFTERVKYLKQQIAGGRFKEDVVILELAKLYADVWTQDAQKWYLLLKDGMKYYREGVNKIPNNSFDLAKVKKLVDQPYSNDAVLVNLYKLQLIKDKDLWAENLMYEIQTVSESFEILIEMNGEFAKRKADQQRINELNNKLETLLITGN